MSAKKDCTPAPIPAMQSKCQIQTGLPRHSTSLPENSSDVDSTYEYTDADAPYSAVEIEEHYWELTTNKDELSARDS